VNAIAPQGGKRRTYNFISFIDSKNQWSVVCDYFLSYHHVNFHMLLKNLERILDLNFLFPTDALIKAFNCTLKKVTFTNLYEIDIDRINKLHAKLPFKEERDNSEIKF
jgi:hypothetical protein